MNVLSDLVPSPNSCKLREFLLDHLLQMFIDSPNATAVLTWGYHFQAPLYQTRMLTAFAQYYLQSELDSLRIQKMIEGMTALGHKVNARVP